ncbi:DUF3105 domain-containing protein [Pseudonocardia aurantiaca]|uniref:DUF3105 domain-containing protein n=1 Tax=Pseudonocardia aurantiaca TaxID=75290 RepID=A0ABW4FP48_9PSEU
MVSGKTSKAARNSRGRTVQRKSTPWGMIAAVLVVVLFAVAVFGYAFMRNEENQAKADALAPFTPTAQNQDPSTQIPGVQVIQYPGGQHVDPNVQVAYTHSPPFGGAHDYSWAACNGVVYPQAVRSENMVHSLEHGAVWIAYNPDQVTGAALQTLSDKVDNQPYTLMSPYPGLDQPISLQSWGHQLKLTDANDPRIDQFIAALRVNQYQHPEPNASCNEIGPGGFSRDAPPPFAPAPAPGTPGSQPETTDGVGVAPDAPPTGS